MGTHHHARGLSLVELLAGLAIGLGVVAAVGAALAGSVHDSRRLQHEMRLMHELRASTDLIARSLRRAGHWGGATAAVRSEGSAIANPYAALAPAAAASDAVAFRHSRDVVENQLVDVNEQFGFRLRSGVIEMQFGGHWQALTDALTLTVTAFQVTPSVQTIVLGGLCPNACPAGSTNCPPRQEVRSVALRIDARAAGNAAVTRTLATDVRLRNDLVTGSLHILRRAAMPTTFPRRARRQRGAAALIVTLLLCFALLLAVLFVHRNLLVEQRMAANQQRSAQAFEAAEAGLEWALAMLNEARPVDAACRVQADPALASFRERYASAAGLATAAQPACVRSAAGWACACPAGGAAMLAASDGPAFRLRFVAGDRPGTIRALAAGCSRAAACSAATAAESEARTEVAFALLPAVASAPAAALTVRGNIDADAAALGAHNAGPASGGVTLHAGGAIVAPNARLSPPAGSPRAESVVERDAALAARSPQRWFAAHFGVEKAAWPRLPGVKTVACGIGDCAAALQSAIGVAQALLFVAGDLAIDTPATFGTPERPVVLVVDGHARLHGAVTLHGLLHSRSLEWNGAAGPAAMLRGAALVEGDYGGDAAADFVRDGDILDRLNRGSGHWVRVPGSWRDF